MGDSKEDSVSRVNKVAFRVAAKENKDKGSAVKQKAQAATNPATSSSDQMPRRSSRAVQSRPEDTGTISLKGLIAAQRFTKGLKERTALKLAAKLGPGARLRKPVTIIYDQVPSTSSKPKEKFSCAGVDELMKNYLVSRLEKVSYDPLVSTRLAQDLSDDIKRMVKKITPPRYKLVCVVTVGKKEKEAAVVASRCLWDTHADSFTSYTYENQSLFCVATIFAVYFE
ncbi:dynein light chain Tctex-type 4-like [Erpetoichthys calabaricus]|uniref:Tctex1 domain-containing protein 4-like n=1 Tax=Erpetoichthys calabaricus TaxID=27687 RepID=A0A8C4S4L0_ERPCA|nr:dynein light chain Tctex-type 4-like [Erpetoichthys calabaricus]XP_028667059.1 dynein light chain Tctex-type 4-like [Erpetoichthys calabaricus]